MQRLHDLMPELQKNHPTSSFDYLKQRNPSEYLTTTIDKLYFPYNSDVRDIGWGCAWRAIQTAIHPQPLSFQALVKTYSRKEDLLQIYLKHHPHDVKILDQLNSRQWTPQQNPNLWAQPFIGHLICCDIEISNQLYLVNQYPAKANAPESVFDSTLTYAQFLGKLTDHFSNHLGVIMIDDATYCLNIWGYTVMPNGIGLLLADPHISSNRHQGTRMAGLYTVYLDHKGRQLSNSVSEEEKKAFAFESYKAVDFFSKGWMVMFVKC